MLFTPATIDYLTNNKTKNAWQDGRSFLTILVVTQLAIPWVNSHLETYRIGALHKKGNKFCRVVVVVVVVVVASST